MPYLEIIRRNRRLYYYATKNFRIGPGKWKKVRKYIGTRKPSKGELAEAFRTIEEKALDEGYRPRPKLAYLDEKDAEIIEDLKDGFFKKLGKLSGDEREKYDTDFLIRFTYNTNAIEGNRLSLRETAMILTEDTIPSEASVNDYNEILNARDALDIARTYGGEFNRRFLLRLHRELTKNTKCRIVGAYRDSEVKISGSEWIPPGPEEVPLSMTKLFQWYNNHKNRLHPLELAAIIHIKLVQIHPFTDGNGRTARLIMNWLLLRTHYPMVIIESKSKIHYYNAIEAADKGNDKAFVHYIARRIIEQLTFTARDQS